MAGAGVKSSASGAAAVRRAASAGVSCSTLESAEKAEPQRRQRNGSPVTRPASLPRSARPMRSTLGSALAAWRRTALASAGFLRAPFASFCRLSSRSASSSSSKSSRSLTAMSATFLCTSNRALSVARFSWPRDWHSTAQSCSMHCVMLISSLALTSQNGTPYRAAIALPSSVLTVRSSERSALRPTRNTVAFSLALRRISLCHCGIFSNDWRFVTSYISSRAWAPR